MLQELIKELENFVKKINMIYLKALFLSLIQAFTEFIPVSSSGHLIIFSNFINFNEIDTDLFNTIIQLASTLAIVVFFKKKLFNVAFTLHKNKKSRKFAYNFIIAFLPVLIFGLTFYNKIKSYLYSNITVATALIIGGILFLLVDKIKIKHQITNLDNINKITSLKIGCYQILSVIPGASRSGSTIVGGLLSKLSRKTAVEFSFILAIPTIISATLYDIYKNFDKILRSNYYILLFGFIITFLVSLIIIKIFIKYISEHNFTLFAYYRIILGTIIIILQLF